MQMELIAFPNSDVFRRSIDDRLQFSHLSRAPFFVILDFGGWRTCTFLQLVQMLTFYEFMMYRWTKCDLITMHNPVLTVHAF